jgi:hypothetical protein
MQSQPNIAALLAAATLALAPIGASAQKVTINGVAQTCASLVAMELDSTTNSVALACSTVDATACQAAGPGTFALLGANGPRPQVAVNSTTSITITRSGGCAGKYYVTYLLTPQTLTGWTLTNGLVNGTVTYVLFEAGEVSKTLYLNTGSTPGHFGIALVKTIKFDSTTTQVALDQTKQFWIDVK